ncbi:hypothetical protein HID58_017537 [Brassica napus]|uniref:Uncharacterized protein n=1 Tax=Brassica napus TaxID=3708 RepID=A0ABQ8DA71_BRANA|nr:hypothetical protein HID58_017537 [Brassica napus]
MVADRVEKEKKERESRSKIGSGDQPARERASHPWWIYRWSKGADVWRVGAMKLGAWSVVFLSPGGGGYYSSIAAGSCLRGVKAYSLDRFVDPLGVSRGVLGFRFVALKWLSAFVKRMRSRLDRSNTPEQG